MCSDQSHLLVVPVPALALALAPCLVRLALRGPPALEGVWVGARREGGRSPPIPSSGPGGKTEAGTSL